jgi:hypothetical protein
MEKRDLFISYEWESRELVDKLVNELEMKYGYKAYVNRINDQTSSNDILNDCTQNNIDNSEILLAFITKRYFESKTCQLEIEFANRIKKKVLYVVLERLALNLYYNAYDEEWTEKTSNKLVNAIYNLKNKIST